MPVITYEPSFNHQVVKSLTKEQFLEQHPDHGHVWDKLNKVEAKQDTADKTQAKPKK